MKRTRYFLVSHDRIQEDNFERPDDVLLCVEVLLMYMNSLTWTLSRVSIVLWNDGMQSSSAIRKGEEPILRQDILLDVQPFCLLRNRGDTDDVLVVRGMSGCSG